MPLYERIRRKEEHGINLRDKRQQKSEALQLASQRLASFVEKKRRAAAMNDDDNEQAHSEAPRRKKKKSKHRPTEVSSKRADYFRRGAPKLNESGIGVEVGAKRYKPLDPRASSLSGHFNEEQFQKNYAFLEEMRNQEIGQGRKRIAAYKATGERGRRMRRQLGLDGGNPNGLEEEQARLKALTQQRAEVERRKIERVAQQNVKRKIKEGVESGKHGAFFLKRTEKKRLEYEEKIKEIRKRKGSKAVEKVLAKKRKRDKSRDAKTFAKYD
jgi:ribosomal RNA-processing protein 36